MMGRRGGSCYRVRGRAIPDDAAQDIDADIVQRRLFAEILGINDARDERITYVGGNRDAAWLRPKWIAGDSPAP